MSNYFPVSWKAFRVGQVLPHNYHKSPNFLDAYRAMDLWGQGSPFVRQNLGDRYGLPQKEALHASETSIVWPATRSLDAGTLIERLSEEDRSLKPRIQCPDCDKTYTRKSYMLCHKRKHD